MKKLYWGIIIVLTILSNGCFEVKQKMSINEDGSGNLVIKMGMAEQMFAMAAANPDGQSDDLFNIFNEDSLRNDFESIDGINVKETKSYLENESKWVEINLDFDSIESLSNYSDGDTASLIGLIST